MQHPIERCALLSFLHDHLSWPKAAELTAPQGHAVAHKDQMEEALTALNAEWPSQGIERLANGVGSASGPAVHVVLGGEEHRVSG